MAAGVAAAAAPVLADTVELLAADIAAEPALEQAAAAILAAGSYRAAAGSDKQLAAAAPAHSSAAPDSTGFADIAADTDRGADCAFCQTKQPAQLPLRLQLSG